MFIPSNESEAKRYNKTMILVYEFVNLMNKFNPAVSLLSDESVKFFIEYTIDTYDDKTNSNYNFIKESIEIMGNKIQNNGYTNDNKVLKMFTKLKERFNDIPPLFLENKTINKEVVKNPKWLHITIDNKQIGKTYIARGREMCNIRFPKNSKYNGYSVAVPKKLIHEKSFLTTNEYIHQINRWDRRTNSWLKIKISSKELKEEMEKNEVNKFREYCKNKILDEDVIYKWIDENGEDRKSNIIMFLDKLNNYGPIYILEDEILSKNGMVFIPEEDMLYNFGHQPICIPTINTEYIAGRLEFKFISESYYNNILNNWSDLYMDKFINLSIHAPDDVEEIIMENVIEI